MAIYLGTQTSRNLIEQPPDPVRAATLESTTDSPRKLEYIDAARGVAILGVVIVHSSQRLPVPMNPYAEFLAGCGRFGVQLFFVASALTLCLSHQARRTESHATASFYIRRFFRIAPMYYVAIALYSVLSISTRIPIGVDATQPVNVLLNVFLLHGLSPSAVNSVVPGGWSIGCEMLFYAVFPMLFNFFIAGRRTLLKLLFVALGCTAASVIISTKLPPLGIGNTDYWFFFILSQLPAFLMGLLVYHFQFHRPGLTVLVRFTIGMVAGLAGILLGGRLIHLTGFLGSMMPAITGLLFGFSLIYAPNLRRIPKWIIEIGRKSYSIYLIHFVFSWILLPLVLQHLPSLASHPELAFVVLASLSLTLSYGVASLTVGLIENRGIQLGRNLIARMG